jgi:hypothetical protein
LLVYSGDLLRALGWPLTIVALVGFAVFLASILKRPAFGPEGLSLAAVASMFLAVIVFQCIAPVPSDERYMLPAVVPLLIFFVKGIRALAVSLTVPFSVPARELALAGLCLIVFAARTFSIPSRLPLGYSRVADLLRDPRSPSKVSLVCSDSNGEGALISEIAMGDKRPDRFVLRSSKVLSENEWDATAYRPYFSTPGKLLEYLDFVPVDAVAVDRSQFMWKGDRDILISTLNSAPDKWRQTADIPSGPISRHLVLYRRIAGATAGDHPNLKVNMRFTLGRVLSLQ